VFDATNIFTKVFAREFYRLNAGFFIVIITLTFGFMSGVEHRALAEFFIASPQLTLIPIVVWIVYTLKVISFNRQRLVQTENIFLYNFSILTYSQQLWVASQPLFLQFAPVMLYGLFLIVMAMKHALIEPIYSITSAVATLLFIAANILVISLKTPIHEPKTSALKRFIDKNAVRPLWWIYITTVLRREPLLFIGTKIFSGLLLFAVMKLYENESFDGRLLGMAASLAGVGNFMIMMQLQLFDLKYFSLMKNLPVHLVVRWARISLATLIIVLPEIILVLKYAPSLHLSDLAFILLLIPTVALTSYSLLYFTFRDESTYARLMFAITIAHIVLILFKVPVWLFVLIDLTVSWILFSNRYYTFESAPSPKK
jgi:hypothetical protein